MSGKLLNQIRTDVNWRSGSFSVRPLLPNNRPVIMPSMTGLGTGKEGIHTKREDSMSILSKLSKTLVAASVACSFAASAMVAEAATKIRVQSVISAKSDEVVMLKDFAQDVFDLTDGRPDTDIHVPADSFVVA